MPTSLVAAPRTKSRMNFFDPFHWNPLTIRSLSSPSIAEVSTVPLQLTVIEPKLVPFAARVAVTGAPDAQACCWASSRIDLSFVVISSARRWIAPSPKTCGALRLIQVAGLPVRPGSRITLLPVSPAPSPAARLWQLLQEFVSGPVMRFGMWLPHIARPSASLPTRSARGKRLKRAPLPMLAPAPSTALKRSEKIASPCVNASR